MRIRLVLLALALIACTPTELEASTLREVPAGPIPAAMFGIHYIAIWVSPAPFPETAGVWRLHGTTHRWHMCHTGPGHWSEQCIDRLTSVLDHFHGTRTPDVPVIYVLGGGGQVWSGTEWIEASHSGFPEWVHPGIIKESWREHVRFLVGRFGDRIDAFEIWNEANSGAWFGGSIRLLADLTVIAAEEIRAVNPDAIIVGPSFTESGHDMMREFYYLLPAGTVDVVGWHHGINNPERDTVRIKEVKRIAGDLPLWLTEYNVEGGASELMRTLLIHWLYGVELSAYYSWEMTRYRPDADSFVHTTYPDGSLTEAGVAFLTLQEWLQGRSVVEWTAEGGEWTVRLSDGHTIAWNDSTMPVRR